MRRAAALQIGELQKDNPLGAQGLIKQVAHRLLRADSWNTRVAACQALEAVLAHLPAWTPTPGSGVPEDAVCRAAARMPRAPAGATLASFSLAAACALPKLLGSRGDEYNESDSDDGDNEDEGADAGAGGVRRERTTRQAACEKRRSKRARTDADAAPAVKQEPCVKQERAGDAHYVATEQPSAETKLLIETLPAAAEVKQERGEGEQEEGSEDEGDAVWPLEGLAQELLVCLEDAAWTVRHGAAMGLRTVVAAAAGAWGGTQRGATAAQTARAHAAWLEGVCVRLLCVMVRDGFTDFSADLAVAPVRETCAQALGAAALRCAPALLEALLARVLELCGSGAAVWELRHTGLLCLRYVAAARPDLGRAAWARVFAAVRASFRDADEDVRGTSALVLLPIAADLEGRAGVAREDVADLVDQLWATLLRLDDLTASTAPVLELLAALYAAPATARALQSRSGSGGSSGGNGSGGGTALLQQIPVVVQYTHHATRRVRVTAFSTLCSILALEHANSDLARAAPAVVKNLFFSAVADADVEDVVARALHTLLGSRRIVRAAVWPLLVPLINALRNHMFLLLRSEPPSAKYHFTPAPKDAAAAAAANSSNSGGSGGSGGSADSEEVSMMLCGNINDAAVAGLLQSGACADALAAGCRLLGACMRSVLPLLPTQASTLVQFLLQYSSQITATIAGLVLSSARPPVPVPATPPTTTTGNNVGLSETVVARLNEIIGAEGGAIQTAVAEPDVRVLTRAAVAAALCAFDPALKLNKCIPALMSHLKRESNARLREGTADVLAGLVARIANAKPLVVAKVAKNLALMLALSEPGDAPFLGAKAAVTRIARLLGDELFDKLPSVLIMVTTPLLPPPEAATAATATTTVSISGDSEWDLLGAMKLYTVLVPCATDRVVDTLLPLLLHLIARVVPPGPDAAPGAAQQWSVSAIAAACERACSQAMVYVIDHLLPLLRPCAATGEKRSAARAVERIVACLDVRVVPYAGFFVGPLLSCMSDQAAEVRTGVAYAFGQLMRLLPLQPACRARSDPCYAHFSDELYARAQREQHFLDQLLDGTKLEGCRLPFSINGQLRKFQQEGINWLVFLQRYHLHGILCDDMGLGKTLQTLCAIGAACAQAENEAARTLPSLIVCPSTLVAHWVSETRKFIAGTVLRPVAYVGTPGERAAIRHALGPRVLLVASYESVRKEYAVLAQVRFNYCVLDEGHMIKNARSKLTQAVKQLQALNRLILTGTPIQNNVLELWSLFDFLMPGFLGTERDFAERYSAPILQSRKPSCTEKERETGLLAMEALHKQVQPFLLRRVKEDVLGDLPPKIVQDYVVDLSPLQAMLYEDFSENSERLLEQAAASSAISEPQAATPASNRTGGLFQALQYFRKICDHPALVLTPNHPLRAKALASLAAQHRELDDVRNSAKLVALRDLLLQCGIGTDDDAAAISGSSSVSSSSSSSELMEETAVTQHRVLVFAQYKAFLDIVERDLFQRCMPSVTYMRLDGNVPPSQRAVIVDKFNSDPTVDVLLLTTQVGGLGLTLTGADVVIFLEHDWNPSKDLQAMDRAHRIGQTKVVNVYRVITRGTIEEKIMGLQRFKTHLANTVVTREKEGSLLTTLDVANMLDLLSYEGASSTSAAAADTTAKPDDEKQQQGDDKPSTTGLGKKVSSLLGQLGEMWNESEYTDEFDVDTFLSKVHQSPQQNK